METRKIQVTGGSSYTVTLPKRWILNQGLDTTGEVDVIEAHSRLIIRPSNAKKKRAITLNIEKLSLRRIRHELIGSFVAGADTITVATRVFTFEQRALVRKVTQQLIGMEIYESASDHVTLRNILREFLSPGEYVEKMLNIIESMNQDIPRVLFDGNHAVAEDIMERDNEIDRMLLLIRRQFQLALYEGGLQNGRHVSLEELYFYLLIAIRIERIADHFVKLCKISLKAPEKALSFSVSDRRHVTRTQRCIGHLRLVILKKDRFTAHEILESYEKYAHGKTLDYAHANEQVIILDSILRIQGYVANIAEESIHYFNLMY